MREIKFAPLRLIKKTGKVTIASYMQWRKIKTSDHQSFKLIIDETYKTFDKDSLVYDHNGKNLFWRHYNPDEIPLLNTYPLIEGEHIKFPNMWRSESMYSAKGLDVDGVPTFSHYTADGIYNAKSDMSEFEPLTVEIVSWWFGWFLWHLNNPKITTISQ